MMTIKKKIVLANLLFLIFGLAQSQSKFNMLLTPSDTLNKPRRNAVVIAETVLGTSALVGLNQLWYADYERSKFHTINDNDDWKQMDKLGHVFSSYQLGRLGTDILSWSGVSKKDQLIYGSTIGLGFLTVVEVFDGYSEEWGFSWGDMIANTMGTGLYVGQELLWNEQRISLKYSFHQTYFSDIRPERLGENFAEQLLKDYNGQTYWLSLNIDAFLKTKKIPKWFNVAIGYGADGLLSGSEDINNVNFSNQNRIRQFYLSLDVDLTRIKTKSHFLKSILGILNVIKVPAPALEISSKGVLKLHPIYF